MYNEFVYRILFHLPPLLPPSHQNHEAHIETNCRNDCNEMYHFHFTDKVTPPSEQSATPVAAVGGTHSGEQYITVIHCVSEGYTGNHKPEGQAVVT